MNTSLLITTLLLVVSAQTQACELTETCDFVTGEHITTPSEIGRASVERFNQLDQQQSDYNNRQYEIQSAIANEKVRQYNETIRSHGYLK